MENTSEVKSKRENLNSRLGFILVAAGCAIGLGNVWRFPYIVGEYGGGAFICLYLLFLVIFGLPVMTMELSVGRASKKSIAESFRTLEPRGTKWHAFGWVGMVGNYLLMMFYTVITSFMFIYFVKMVKGDFSTLEQGEISAQYSAMTADPLLVVGVTALVVVLGILICSLGLKNGVEKVTKVMMIALLVIIVALAVYVCTLPGAVSGLEYYLVPNFSKMFEKGIGEVLMAALSQAFFTLSIGMGSLAIFGSYVDKNRSMFGESIIIASLDTFVAFVAGLIVIPACFAFGVDQAGGPGLVFQTLPLVFNQMPGGDVIGGIFFLFMIFAAMSTVIAVFENVIAFGMDKWGWSRRKSCLINLALLLVLVLPCAFGFNLLSDLKPLGAGSSIMDLEDFIVSNNILPLGALVYVLFCTFDKKGWGYENFLLEANQGKGLKFPKWARIYCKYVLPFVLLFIWAQGVIMTFI